MATQNGVVKRLRAPLDHIIVDGFNFPSPDVRLYFLTHAHGDHTCGLHARFLDEDECDEGACGEGRHEGGPPGGEKEDAECGGGGCVGSSAGELGAGAAAAPSKGSLLDERACSRGGGAARHDATKKTRRRQREIWCSPITARLLGATIGLDARHPRLRTLSPGEVGRDGVARWASAEMVWRTRSPSLHH